MSPADLPAPRRLAALPMALALILAACGTDEPSTDAAPGDAVAAGESASTGPTASSTTSPSAAAATTSAEATTDAGPAGAGGGAEATGTDATEAEALGTTTGPEEDQGDGASAPDAPEGSTVAPAMALGPDGLILIRADTGSTTFVDFGTPTATVLPAIESAIGPPNEVLEGNPECGNGQAVVVIWDDAISLDFNREDQFLAWGLRPGSELTTMAGVGLGSTRQEVDAAIVVDVSETSLGTEFATGEDGRGIAGLLDGPDPADPVIELWAGSICAFR